MNNLQKLGGVAAILESLIYIMAFIIYGAILEFPVDPNISQELAFLVDNQLMLSLLNLITYVLFGVLLAVLVLALQQRLKQHSPAVIYAGAVSQLASVFGFVWVGLVIASGMIGNIGLASVVKLAAEEPERAITVWYTLVTITEGLGGGNEVVGGLWVLLLSYAGLKSSCLPRALSYFGMFVGLVGVLTIYPDEILTEIFGISQIIWFIWIGITLQRNEANVMG